MKYFTLSIIVLLVVSCATIEDHRVMSQPTDTQLMASIGSTVFRMDKSSDLPNVFGAADIYGGKVDRGFTEVKLYGIREKQFVTFLVNDLSLNSTETVMDRYVVPMNSYGSNVNVDNNINPTSSTGGILVELDTSEENIYTISGIQIEIINVMGSSISYIIRDISASSEVKSHKVSYD